MKPFLLVALILLGAYTGRAQQYQCLQPGIKQYFTNGKHYLRGMRIDSVKTTGTATLLYPFRTKRSTDSFGGSWLGKQVMELPDGTTYFDNILGDTLVIKTQAGVGSQWVFYNDTTTVFYTASIISVDTATVSGQLDSVKTIQIQAMQGSAVLSTDPVSSYVIRLSKAHGFVQIFDLYTFPYHRSGQPYSDYYLNLNNYTIPASSIFRLTSFNNPVNSELYNYAVGDKFQFDNNYDHVYTSTETWTTDSVLSKSVVPGGVTYDVFTRSSSYTHSNSGPGGG